ncbi:hypothetical protein TSUD_05820 [Trifolium subterraneum]|uniref:Kinesin-like protein n=1 Tax=Trifolium subterraneum TaxID=3900 RepID=A0A2Z6MNW0_TRISU|nr:hypothetical protein TSUD_05820 [Trifolium subterraneum]
MEKICVAVRVRPLVSSDSVNGSFWKVEDNRISLHKIHGTPFSGSSYAFDHIFDESSTNSSVYEHLTKDIILAALNGFNVSYMEIYNEEINDLLVVESQKLQIHESLERGVFVAGLREEVVNNAEQVLDLIKAGEVNRHFGETNMNVRSSRSHTIFRMVIESKGKDSNSSDDSSINDIVRVSVLNLVDLAGSERIAKTGADGVRLKEGKYINKSLMVLGNVINKLSEGSKQRGHIPYRDSKLTRILQPALGGNAKTSIICTVAPEEVHIEETKGTLQFASRAKRITNCVQVNEILTDAALLKRQQLEIEELRKKLQGSHAGVLEQEILKLRNDLLKYEMERGKLEMELEEERKSRNQWISEQQMKIENSSIASFSVSDCGTNDNQGPRYLRRQGFREEYSDVNSTSHGDIFKSPCLKTASAFVVKRSKYSILPDSSPLRDSSPLPDAFNNVADEDTWLKMNNGYVANLDSPQTTPTRNFQSFPPSDTTPRKHSEEVLSSKQLIGEIPDNQQETKLIQELPLRLSESVENYKDSFEEVLSAMQRFALDGKFSTEKMLSTMSDIGAQLFATLEGQLTMFTNGERSSTANYALIQEPQKEFQERLKNIITSLELSESSITKNQDRTPLCSCEHKDSGLGGEIASSKDAFNERYESLEKKLLLLKNERDSLLHKFTESSDKLATVAMEKENVLKDLNTEVRRRKKLEVEVKQFTSAFVCRQKSLISLRSDLKTKIEKWKAQTPISVPKSFGCED